MVAVTELPIGQHVAAIAAGQVDAVYTLEPTGTIGRLNGTTRLVEAGVVAHYILGDPMAPWHGGAASLTTEFIKKYPAETKKFIAAYARGIELVRSKPDEARQFMKGYTPIEDTLTSEVPLASYMLYNEFKTSDVAYFQKFYDLFSAFGALLIVLFNSAYGVINARKQRIMAAKVMGASRWQIFRDVLIWESLQPTFVGLRSAVSMALVIVIVAEMFIGSDNGLGHRIIDAQQVLNVKSMYAAILAAGALGYALNVLFLLLERRIVHWSGR